MKKLNPVDFFASLSAENNYISPRDVQAFYYSLIRLIMKELRNKGKIKLPNFGEIRITTYKARKIGDINRRGQSIDLPPTSVIKFIASRPLAAHVKYFK